MSNDRLFLRHKPSGVSIMIGKHLNCGWYAPPEKLTFQKYYDCLFENYEFREDLSEKPYEFELVYETDNNFDWNYPEMKRVNNFLVIKRKDNA